ncbi:MAG: MBL fold metallo-hydrolase [Candidatus Harrisonbacteria bacterium]|nr:MBL fold metallo-hydrolase [Candidatus Harrisonbacteria bacterium]
MRQRKKRQAPKIAHGKIKEMKLRFIGGAGEVTGACYLLEGTATKILIDCGLRQGSAETEIKNWNPFPFPPESLDAVLITHSHIDHIGLLPRLSRGNFRAKIFSTEPCREFSEILLFDSMRLINEDGLRRGLGELYTESNIYKAMDHWQAVEYYKTFTIGEFSITFYNAGHILGSSFILVTDGKKRIVFSGDLGNSPAPLIGSKDSLPYCDYCLIESAYGDRLHENSLSRREIIEDVIEDVVLSKGVLLIPSFAMERTQQLLFEIDQLFEEGRVPRVPVYVDSPLALKLTEVYKRFKKYWSGETQMLKSSDGSLFSFSGLHKSFSSEDSKRIDTAPNPKVIIAGSGMSHGGRILRHEKLYLNNPRTFLFIVGYQGIGSIGRAILEGKKSIKIQGEEVSIQAKVVATSGYSAHADQAQLLAWLKPQSQGMRQVFIVQGEALSGVALAVKIRDELALDAIIPKENEVRDII